MLPTRFSKQKVNLVSINWNKRKTEPLVDSANGGGPGDVCFCCGHTRSAHTWVPWVLLSLEQPPCLRCHCIRFRLSPLDVHPK